MLGRAAVRAHRVGVGLDGEPALDLDVEQLLEPVDARSDRRPRVAFGDSTGVLLAEHPFEQARRQRAR